MEYDLYHAQIPVHNDSIQQIKDFNTMGPIASFIQGLDKAAEKEEAAKKALEIGIKMVQNRFENFEANLNLPVGAVKKQTAKGIVNTLFTGLDMILGSFNASYDESQDYMVLTNLIGGVYRIDYPVLQQKIQGKGFSDKITSVFGSYLIITAINKKELLTDNVYKILVDRQFASFTVFIKFILVKLLKEEELTPEEVSAIGNLTYADLEFNQDGFLLNAEGKLVYQNQKPGSDVDISKIKTILKQDVDEMTSKQLDQEIELNNKVIRSLKRAVVKAEKNQKEIEDQLKKAQDKISNLTEQLRAQQDIAKILENQIAIKKKDQEVDNLTKNINQLHLKEEDLKTVMSVLKRVQKKKRQELHN